MQDKTFRKQTACCVTEIPRIRRNEVALPDEFRVKAITMLAKALNDPIRVQIVYLLSKYRDLCTCEFEEILGLPQSKVSYHLKQLLDAELIKRDIHGPWSHYSLVRMDILEQLERLLPVSAQ